MKLLFTFCNVTIFLVLLVTNSYSQVGDAYERAAATAKIAASKTQCLERKQYCLKIAAWCECMAEIGKTGISKSCGDQPGGDPPPCEADNMGSSTNSSSSTKTDPIKDMQLNQQQLQQDLNNAQDASTAAFNNATNNGKKTSGAMVDATLAGAQYISDPKSSLAYTGVGLSVALVSWISEKKEAQRAAMLKKEEEERLSRLEELKRVKASLRTSSIVFDFVKGTTDYHVTNLKINIKHGMVKNIVRKDLYNVSVEIHKILNTADSIFIYESVKFMNLSTSTDSCVISKISIPIHFIQECQLYDGNYTNSYDPQSNIDQIFRHKSLTNLDIKEAFTIDPMNNEGKV